MNFIKKLFARKSGANSLKNQINLDSIESKYKIDAEKFAISKQNFPKPALEIVTTLQKNGYQAFIVGGAIRDLLLAKAQKDFDIVTNANPNQIKDIFKQRCRIIGRRFRLAHIFYRANGKNNYIEVATFRADDEVIQNSNLRSQTENGLILRDNIYGNLYQDVKRRDFTINALYFNPSNNIIYDFYNGIQDLNNAQLRLIGDPKTRFLEDPVRILRAIRFMAKLDFFLPHEYLELIQQLKDNLLQIPKARLFDESIKLLQGGCGFKTYQLLRQYGLLDYVVLDLNECLTEHNDSNCDRIIELALKSTDERIANKLSINPAFLFACFFYYPMRSKVEQLKNEANLNNNDAFNIAISDLNATFVKMCMPKRLIAVINDIWMLQLRLDKRLNSKQIDFAFNHPRFRAAFDLLAMRAELESNETIERLKWWHEYQQSNKSQRQDLTQQRENKAKFNADFRKSSKNAGSNDAKTITKAKKRKPRRKKKATSDVS